MFRKRNASARDVDVINKHLAEQRAQGTEAEDKPVTADDIELDVPLEKETAVRDMLRRHEPMWTGALGEIRTSEMRIDLVDNARPFRSPPYRAGPKTRELEQAEVDKQLKAGVIEPAYSEWAAPVLFAPKKDGRLRCRSTSLSRTRIGGTTKNKRWGVSQNLGKGLSFCIKANGKVGTGR